MILKLYTYYFKQQLLTKLGDLVDIPKYEKPTKKDFEHVYVQNSPLICKEENSYRNMS